MSVVCPAGVAAVPAAEVWKVLTEPRRFTEWMDVWPVQGCERPLRTGDVMKMRAKPVPLAVHWNVLQVDQSKLRLRLRIGLPFGIVNDETITVVPQGDQRTLVRFY